MGYAAENSGGKCIAQVLPDTSFVNRPHHSRNPLLYFTETGDLNCDGAIDAFDIEPFLDLLFPEPVAGARGSYVGIERGSVSSCLRLAQGLDDQPVYLARLGIEDADFEVIVRELLA